MTTDCQFRDVVAQAGGDPSGCVGVASLVLEQDGERVNSCRYCAIVGGRGWDELGWAPADELGDRHAENLRRWEANHAARGADA